MKTGIKIFVIFFGSYRWIISSDIGIVIHEAYKTYLAYYCKGSSINEPIQYKNSTLIIHQPTEYEFGNNVGYPFLIDTRKSRGYTNLEEKAERSDTQLLIRLKLKKSCNN